MKNKEHQLDKLIENYLKNESSENEHLLLNQFAKSFRKKLDWDEVQMGNKAEIATEIRQKVTQFRIQRQQKRIRSKRIQLGVSIAASLLLVIGLSFWLQSSIQKTEVFYAETGSKIDSLQLPDGSVLFLSPETKVCYDNHFNHKTREIELVEGNAFFKVARNPQKPFIITSGAIRTKVLGTSFNIHMGIDGYKVTVHTGKVNVSSASESVNLVPFQEVSYSTNNQKLSVTRVSKEDLSPWYRSDLTLTDQSLKTILGLVEKKFGVGISRIKAEQLTIRATVFIARDASLESILQQINYITNLKLEANGKEISCNN